MSDLGNFGTITGAPQQRRLVTPYQKVLPELVRFWNAAQKKQRSMIYSDTRPEWYQAFTVHLKAGKDAKTIFDHTQEAGHYEHPLILQLIKDGAVDGKDFVIGTSPESGALCHIKASWNDDAVIEDGSLNWSKSGLEEINTVSFTTWPAWAKYLNQIFDQAWSFILQHEERYQIGGVAQ